MKNWIAQLARHSRIVTALLTRAQSAPAAQQRAVRRAGLGLYSGGMTINGIAVGSLFLAAFPNPFCLIYNAINPWAFGAIMLGLIGAVIGAALAFINPSAGAKLIGGLIFLGIAMFLLGIVSTQAGLDSVAGMFGVPPGHWCAAT